jgi:hypothetical protein
VLGPKFKPESPRTLNLVVISTPRNFVAVVSLLKNSVACVRERTIPIEQTPLVGEVNADFFADRGCQVVSVMDLYDRILGFLDRSR